MLKNKKSLFKLLNKDFIKIKYCEFIELFVKLQNFLKLKPQV